MSFKLLIEKTDPQEFEYILEEKNTKETPRLYIKGPYMMADGVNKNKRVYDLDNMIEEVARYEKEMIKNDKESAIKDNLLKNKGYDLTFPRD